MIVVRRGAGTRFDELQQKTVGLPIVVSWDRRQAQRRTSGGFLEHDRRRSDRRLEPPLTWRFADFIVVCEAAQQRRPIGARQTVRSAREAEESPARYWIVQPWGRHQGQVSRLSGYGTLSQAFEEMDGMFAKMAHSGLPSDEIELLVVDQAGQVIARPQKP